MQAHWFWTALLIEIGLCGGCSLQDSSYLQYPEGVWDTRPRTVRHDLDGDDKPETIAVTQQFDGEFTTEAVLRILNADQEVGRVAIPDHFTSLELVNLTQGRNREIVVWSEGGAHCKNLQVIQYQGNRLNKLFEASSPAGIEFRKSPDGLQIWIARADWKDPTWNYGTGVPLWEVYAWDGASFEHRSDLSTAPGPS